MMVVFFLLQTRLSCKGELHPAFSTQPSVFEVQWAVEKFGVVLPWDSDSIFQRKIALLWKLDANSPEWMRV